MPNLYKILGQSLLSPAARVDLYTVPTGKSALVSSVFLCNQSATVQAAVTISVAIAGAADTAAQYIYGGFVVGPGDTLPLVAPITLGPLDVLRVVFTGSGNCSVSAFGTEISP